MTNSRTIKKNSFKGGRTKKKKDKKKDRVKKKNSFKKQRKVKFAMGISKKRYKELLEKKKTKKRMKKKEKEQLNRALSYSYCRCISSFERKGDKKGYGICMNSIYKKRKIDPPFAISLNCKNILKK